jgi:hypothetical protein
MYVLEESERSCMCSMGLSGHVCVLWRKLSGRVCNRGK